MSQFEAQLERAKKRQVILYLSFILLFFIGTSIIIVTIFFTRATRFEIMPSNVALSSSIKVKEGLAIIIGNTIYLISNSPRLLVSAKGFYDKTRQISKSDIGGLLKIELQPLPATVALKSNAGNGTNWSINGRFYKKSEELIVELDAGVYNILLDHPYFLEKELQLELNRGEAYKDTVVLDRIQGELSVDSVPTKARVSIDNKQHGSTPLKITLDGGSHDVILSHDNYQVITDTITISRTEPEPARNYNMRLKKEVVKLNLSPVGGRLLLNNLALKVSGEIKVDVGRKHTLVYSKPGYFSQSRTFSVDVNQTKTLDFQLKKEMGEIEIESTPIAEVRIDNAYVGNTPLKIALDSTKHTVEIGKPGFRSVVKKVTPSAARTKKIVVNLIVEEKARIREAPLEYTHSAGGIMRLFVVNDVYTMGAKRSEPGQRANEFLKRVELTRPFYAGLHEVANSSYKQFDNTNNGKPGLPVTGINWIAAVRFCNWLSDRENLTRVYDIAGDKLIAVNADSDGYRLLTEAEWEWLARKANRNKETRFVWGNEQIIPKNTANIADESARGNVSIFVPKYNDGFASASPTGTFMVEKSGLYDQGGNVSEWTNDSYSIIPPKEKQTYIDPFDTVLTGTHVVKGANWRSGSVTELRASYREGASGARDDIGFRIGRYLYGKQ